MSDRSLCAESADALISRELKKAIAEPSFQRIIVFAFTRIAGLPVYADHFEIADLIIW